MDLQLRDKTALITGSSAGIGFASAVALAQEGASVVLNGRGADRLANAEQRLLSRVPRASVRTSAADVSTAEGADDLIEALPDVDILINNAAALGPQPFAEIPDAEWTRFFETNVMSGVRLSRHYLPAMLTRNSGRILFVSSESAVHVTAGQLHYAVTKTALLALSRGLAEMTRGTEVTVNTILPGPTATEGVDTMIEGVAGQTGMSRDQIVEHFFATDQAGSLLQRLATPDEVANLIAYLASPLASVTNGAVVRAEGGTVASIL
jgi:3-oxoacyl-[acyl-carrier protein] reductase